MTLPRLAPYADSDGDFVLRSPIVFDDSYTDFNSAQWISEPEKLLPVVLPTSQYYTPIGYDSLPIRMPTSTPYISTFQMPLPPPDESVLYPTNNLTAVNGQSFWDALGSFFAQKPPSIPMPETPPFIERQTQTPQVYRPPQTTTPKLNNTALWLMIIAAASITIYTLKKSKKK